RICLNQVFEDCPLIPDGAAGHADNARGKGLPQTERIPHGEDPLSDFKGVRISESDRFKGPVPNVHFYHCQIIVRVRSSNSGFESSTVGEHDPDILRSGDNVAVRNDQSVLPEYDPRSGTRYGRSRTEEKLGLARLGRDVHHGWRNPFEGL